MENPNTHKRAHKVIAIAVAQHERDLAKRYCGQTLEHRIVLALEAAGCLSKSAYEDPALTEDCELVGQPKAIVFERLDAINAQYVTICDDGVFTPILTTDYRPDRRQLSFENGVCVRVDRC